MGKRRKPSRKKNYQDISEVIEDNAMRKAGDNITEEDVIRALGETVLDELQGKIREDELVAEAMEFIPRRKAQLAAMSNNPGFRELINSPDTPLKSRLFQLTAAENELARLQQLRGGVPAPLVRDRGKTRTHVEYEVNPITGQTEVIPYMDPSNPSTVLRTEYGQMDVEKVTDYVNQYRHRRTGEVYDNPSEYVGLQALKLMGRPARVGNDVSHHRTDLKDPSDSRMGNIDVERGNMELDANTLPIHLTSTLVSPMRGKDVFNQYMRSNPEASNLLSVIDQLRTLPNVQNTPDIMYFGKGAKALKTDPDERYDQVLSLGYTGDEGRQKLDKRGIAAAPGEINMVKLRPTLDAIVEQGRNLTIHPSRVTPSKWLVHSVDHKDSVSGQKQAGGFKSNLKANVPKGYRLKGDGRYGGKQGEAVNYSVTDAYPLTQQLLSQLPIIE